MFFGMFGKFMDTYLWFSQMLAKFVKMQQSKSPHEEKFKNFYTSDI